MGEGLKWTGERLTTAIYDDVAMEHLARYAFCIPHVKNKIVLDLGCGEGYGVHLLAQHAEKVVGVDMDKVSIEHAIDKYGRNNTEFILTDITKLPYANAIFDIVISFETIEHIDTHEKMMEEVKRVLKPDGVFIISTPDKVNYSINRNYTNPYHKKELTRDEFSSLLKKFYTNSEIFAQQSIHASKIYASNDIPNSSVEFTGTFEDIMPEKKLIEPLYWIALASDINLPQINTFYFHGDYLMQKKEEQLRLMYENAWSYKIGRLITFPVRELRRILKK